MCPVLQTVQLQIRDMTSIAFPLLQTAGRKVRMRRFMGGGEFAEVVLGSEKRESPSSFVQTIQAQCHLQNRAKVIHECAAEYSLSPRQGDARTASPMGLERHKISSMPAILRPELGSFLAGQSVSQSPKTV